MSGPRVFFIVLTAAALWHADQEWKLRAVHPADGVLAPNDPLQTDLSDAPVITRGRWTLTPRARYDVTARILGREDYHFDAISDLIPEDLALGWGGMSDSRVLQAFEIGQSGRFYFWKPRGELPVERQAVIEHSANTHLIPADSRVGAQLTRLRVGQVVHLTGLLVDGKRDDQAYIRTSLSRSDSGAGACEVLLVEQVEIL